MQCASSIATSAGFSAATSAIRSGLLSCSGVMKRNSGPTLADLGDRLGLLGGRLVRADPHRPQLRALPLVEGGDLVLLEGQQRGDHHCGAGDQAGRDLVDRRLAGAGGQHHKRVASLHHRAHGGQLVGPQRLPAEKAAGRAAQRHRVRGQFHRGPEVPEPMTAETHSDDHGLRFRSRSRLSAAGAGPRAGRGRTGPGSAGRCWPRRPRRSRPWRTCRSSPGARRRCCRRRTPPSASPA